MRERIRLAVESAGAILIVVALGMVHIELGMIVGGGLLIVAANFYMEDSDAGTDQHDSTGT